MEKNKAELVTNLAACIADALTNKPEQVTSAPPRLISKAEFLQSIPISLPTLNRRIKSGEISSKKIGRRCFIPYSEVERLCQVERRKRQFIPLRAV